MKTWTMEKIKQQMELQSMVIPGLIFVVIFSYVPLAGLVIAFKDYQIFNGILDSPWVGLKHFKEFYENRNFLLIMRNTLSISFLKLVFGFPAPIILAVLLNELNKQKLKKIFQTITYMPHFISWVIVSGMVISMLAVDGGVVNWILEKTGIIDSPVNFLSTPEYFWGILVSVTVWKNIGFNSIIFMAAISGINPDFYEAASIDGASRFKQIFIVTLSCIIPQIIIMLILNISHILNAGFEDILLLTNNGENAVLLQVSDVIDTYVYRMGVKSQRFSFATAVGLFKSVVNVAMLFLANAFARKVTGEGLW